jgi:hypothetical protein
MTTQTNVLLKVKEKTAKIYKAFWQSKKNS